MKSLQIPDDMAKVDTVKECRLLTAAARCGTERSRLSIAERELGAWRRGGAGGKGGGEREKEDRKKREGCF